MSKSLKNALKATAVLVCITAVCIAVLTLCNMFFPKYKPTLDTATAKLINRICPTGQSDADAKKDGYIVLLNEDSYGANIASFNKSNKSRKAEILAVYGEPKGDNMEAYIIEAKSSGRDGDVVILTAYRGGKIVGATVKKQSESYFGKLPSNLFDSVFGADAFSDVNMKDIVGKTGATLSLTAIERAVNISNSFAKVYNDSIIAALSSLNYSENPSHEVRA
ncbi:MAG: FMN-binding protein [Clostridiales bacterium]|nr:FMN-binding protein [Clostridiales bacterium]